MVAPMRNMTVGDLRDALAGKPRDARVFVECEHDTSTSFAHVVTAVTLEQLKRDAMLDDIVVLSSGDDQVKDVFPGSRDAYWD